MSATAPTRIWGIPADRRIVGGGASLAILASIVMLMAWLLQAPALLRGWLLAFVITGSVPVGSMVWLMIHQLTGGRWGTATAPVFRPAAAVLPLMLIAFFPVAAGTWHIYPWARHAALVTHDVAVWYLNPPLFAARGLIAITGWSVLGMLFAFGAGGALMAGLGLAFFGLSVSFVAVDWLLSLEPHYVATAFAPMIAIQYLLLALAVAALALAPKLDSKVRSDLGGLLIAAVLGVVYLEFMTFVIAWYGDLPDKASWYLKRAEAGWLTVLIAAFLLGAAVPFALLIVTRIRQSSVGLSAASALIILGSILHLTWLAVPAFDDPAPVLLSASAILAAICVIARLMAPTMFHRLEACHGS
jgi:hypothetical protein